MTLHDQKIPEPCFNWWIGVMWIIFGLLWCFYQLFGLSFWWHPFTAEDPLVSKWCSATFLQFCSDEETNSFTFWCHRHTFSNTARNLPWLLFTGTCSSSPHTSAQLTLHSMSGHSVFLLCLARSFKGLLCLALDVWRNCTPIMPS